jgi:hypothetical protein
MCPRLCSKGLRCSSVVVLLGAVLRRSVMMMMYDRSARGVRGDTHTPWGSAAHEFGMAGWGTLNIGIVCVCVCVDVKHGWGLAGGRLGDIEH